MTSRGRCAKLISSPANAEAAQLYKDNTKEYERRVKVSCLAIDDELQADAVANGRTVLGRQ